MAQAQQIRQMILTIDDISMFLQPTRREYDIVYDNIPYRLGNKKHWGRRNRH